MAISIAIYYGGRRVNDGPYSLTVPEYEALMRSGTESASAHGYITGSVDLEAGAIGTATFTLPPGHPMNSKGYFAKRDPNHEVVIREIYPWGEEAELFRGWVLDTTRDMDLRLKVSCEGVLAYLKLTRVRPYTCTASQGLGDGCEIVNGDAFRWIVGQHNLWAGPDYAFELGPSCYAGPVDGGTDFKTSWEELNQKFCDKLDRYLNASTGPSGNRQIELLDGGRGASTQAIVVGENVIDMSIGESSMEVVTAIVARGRSDDTYEAGHNERVNQRDIGLADCRNTVIHGKCSDITLEGDRAVNWQMVEAYGYLEEKRDYDAKTPEELFIAAAKDLDPAEINERDVCAFDVQAADMHYVDPSVQPIRILDWAEVYVRADGYEVAEPKGRTIFHGWLPCTKIHFDLGNPVASVFHFGDIEPTFTRKSALRLGMVLSNTEGLVRRADGIPWNNDRFFNKAEQVEDDMHAGDDALEDLIGETAESWSQHLADQFDEATARWYEHLDEAIDGVSKQDAQGREELLKHIEELEGKWSDDLGHIDGEISDLSEEYRQNHQQLLDGIKDVAKSAQRTFFGICRTGTGYTAKTVTYADLTQPGGESFALAKGIVVDVLFQNAEEAYNVTLDIAGTGSRYIVTNGSNIAIWQSGAVMRLLYDGSQWQNCSNDIYGRSLTVGNSSQANVRITGNDLNLRIGSTNYIHAGMDGVTVGLLTQPHVDVSSSAIKLRSQNERGLTVTDQLVTMDLGPVGRAPKTLSIGVSESLMGIYGTEMHMRVRDELELASRSMTWNKGPVIMKSVVTTAKGDEYVPINVSLLGVSSISGYAFAVTNGDYAAKDFFAIGTKVDSTTLHVICDRPISGQIRLNVLGWPVNNSYPYSDQGLPGPEIFGDGGAEEPTYETPEGYPAADR